MQENLNISVYQPLDLRFLRRAQDKKFLYEDGWPTDPYNWKDFNPPGDIEHYSYDDDSARMIYDVDGILTVQAQLHKRGIALKIASDHKQQIEDHIKKIKKLLPLAEEADDGKVKVKFWYQGSSGPSYVEREIVVPDWEQISGNYVANTRKGLESLLHDFVPSHGGQLILWQGDPGTGKTYALRSLTDAWKEWCSVEYIVDPDQFFGANVGYLMQLVSSSHDAYDEFEDDEGDKKEKEWKLFILEDTGELLSVDARERAGQGLARLLNVVDGFIGQGLKILVLITSNEDLGKLHPAVSRPGRCAAVAKFDSLDYESAQEWANERGIKLPGKRDYSLAELFALVNDYNNKPEQNLASAFGFRKPE